MNKIPLRYLILIPLLAFLSCGSDLWNLSLSQINQSFHKGDYSFLTKINDEDLLASDTKNLGPGADYFIGVVLQEQKRTKLARSFWLRSWSKDAQPWKERSALRLYESYTQTKDWDQAEVQVSHLLELDKNNPLYLFYNLKTLYWEKKDTQAWVWLERYENVFKALDDSQKEEMRLIKAVLAYRVGKRAEAEKLLNDLVFNTDPSLIHYRLYGFFEEDPSRYAILGSLGRWAVLWQSIAGQEMAKDAKDFLVKQPLPKEFWTHKVFISGFASLFSSNSAAPWALAYLEKYRNTLTGEAKFEAQMAQGRFYRVQGKNKEAQKVFRDSLSMAQTSVEKKRSYWNWLQCELNASATGQASELLYSFRQALGQTDDPAYFSDLVSTWFSQLIQQRSWETLTSTYRDCKNYLALDDQVTLEFILARLDQHGFLNLTRSSLGVTSKDLLEDIINKVPFSYEALVSMAVLDQNLDFSKPLTDESVLDSTIGQSKTPVIQLGGKETASEDLLVKGYISFGLLEIAYDEVLSSIEKKNLLPITPDTLRNLSAELQTRQLYRQSLELMYPGIHALDYPINRKDWELLFPKAYQDLVQDRVQKENLSLSLFWALMREESSFDSQARSWVSAKGLTQLMPETASYIAKRMKYGTFDLNDPTDNVSLGAHYFATLMDAQEQPYLALMAYNAGGGRVRSWKNLLGRLPQEVFVEGVPFAETRFYVKKILRSAVMYSVLYEGKSISQVVKMVYSNFKP